MLVRRPRPELRPFVRMLWYSEDSAAETAGRERLLPSGEMHVVFRLCEEPIRVFRSLADPSGVLLGSAVVGGVRDGFYVKDPVTRPVITVGAMLLPSASLGLFGAPASELAGQHTRLDDLWGTGAGGARPRLQEAREPSGKLDVLEALLAARLPRVQGVHPAVAMALERLQTGAAVNVVVSESGYSHRRFSSLFAQAVGLAPKRYSRVRRFQRTVAAMAAGPSAHLVDLAMAGGYADQAHFTREFLDFAGVTPGEYRSLSPAEPMHVPVAGGPR